MLCSGGGTRTLEKANAKKLETATKKIQNLAWLACMTVDARQAAALSRKDYAVAAKDQKQMQKIEELAAMHAPISAALLKFTQSQSIDQKHNQETKRLARDIFRS